MVVQDDAREEELRILFDLEKPEGSGRGDTDAIMTCPNGRVIEFELKSTTRGSVTTVRDFGPDHIRKWADKHWLIGVYDARGRELRYTLYGSPTAMAPWIKEKERYIAPDFRLAELVEERITFEDLYQVAGEKESYRLEDARALHKKQLRKLEYENLMDRDGGYSPSRMLEILRKRASYLVRRGSTLNNPHIPESFFRDWSPITESHATELRRRVEDWLQDRT